ncbi:putative DUF1993 domain-containing protein [Seiridium cardinale]|uniref:DUF1993 domain-containing protein n=1 Tax=Seiridium cardinale TaxID=138064 RepID=A0ABR2XWM8_9PEZI
MSSLSLPNLTVETFTKGLETYAHILAKAQEYAKENNIDNATKAVQANLGRLSGVEPTLFENNEQTFEDLQKRIAKTLDVVKAFDASKAEGRDQEILDFPWGGQTHKITVKAAVFTQGLPNFFFHLTTGYSILRSRGVPLGKADFLGSFLAL